MELADAPIWESAHRHDISDEDIRHAMAHILNDADDPKDET